MGREKETLRRGAGTRVTVLTKTRVWASRGPNFVSGPKALAISLPRVLTIRPVGVIGPGFHGFSFSNKWINQQEEANEFSDSSADFARFSVDQIKSLQLIWVFQWFRCVVSLGGRASPEAAHRRWIPGSARR
jgi:hypothetical protein